MCKRYKYSVTVLDKQRGEFLTAPEVTKFVNEAMGFAAVSTDMVFNYFDRPHYSNKRLFHGSEDREPVVKVERTRIMTLPTTS